MMLHHGSFIHSLPEYQGRIFLIRRRDIIQDYITVAKTTYRRKCSTVGSTKVMWATYFLPCLIEARWLGGNLKKIAEHSHYEWPSLFRSCKYLDVIKLNKHLLHPFSPFRFN